MTDRPWKTSGIAVEYWYPMLQYTASQSAAAHIMKPVVSISMSPESFSSGLTCGMCPPPWAGLWRLRTARWKYPACHAVQRSLFVLRNNGAIMAQIAPAPRGLG